MKLLWIVSIAIATTGLVGAADLPKGDTIIDRYVEVTGGRQNYEKRTSEYASGTVAMQRPASRAKSNGGPPPLTAGPR